MAMQFLLNAGEHSLCIRCISRRQITADALEIF